MQIYKDNLGESCQDDYVEENFPELLALKPDEETYFSLWWPCTDFDSRINVLQSCIKQVKDENSI